MRKGMSHSYLLSVADYLLLIVNMLAMTDGQARKIRIQAIKDAAVVWSKTVKNHPMKRQLTRDLHPLDNAHAEHTKNNKEYNNNCYAPCYFLC